jgi:glycosidase
MKIILDEVANHLSDRSRYFVEARDSGRASPFYDYFARDASGAPQHYFDWSHLENLNYRNRAVEDFEIAAFAHWLKGFDVDGFRVDAAWGPAERDRAFLPRLAAALKAIKPDVLLLAEAPAHDPYYARAGFAAAYDWGDRLGHWAWQDAFDHPDSTAARLRDAIAASAGSAGLVLRFLDNNDTGARFVTRYGLPTARVAAAMLLTLPGLPALYTGDEVGAAFEPYGAAPPAIDWSAHHGLRDWYARLLAVRRADPALRSRMLTFLDLAPADRLLAYLRGSGDARVLVLLNYGAAPIDVALPAAVPSAQFGDDAVDLLSCRPIALRDDRSIALEGFGVRIIGKRNDPACRG